MAYSIDLRKKAMEYLEKGHSQREARDTFNISLSTINKWHQQYEKTGKLEDKKPCRKPKKLDPKELISYVKKHPDAYLKEIGKVFNCSDTAVQKAFKRLGITRKKRGKDIKNKTL